MVRPDPARDSEKRLLLLHVPASRRGATAALLALHERLSSIVASGHEPMLRRIKLAWWRDALAALDTAPPPAEPLLAALADEVVGDGVRGADLAEIAAGWDQLFAEPRNAAVLEQFADGAGATLFAALARLLGSADGNVRLAGQGWALVALMRFSTDVEVRSLAGSMAAARLEEALRTRWPRRLRPLVMLAALAWSDLRGAPPGTPARAMLLWRVRLVGR